jgi:hypothetical protein
VQLPFSEVITIDRHLDIGELRSYLDTAPLEDLRDSATPPPSAADERGRSAQQFAVDVVVHRRSDTRRIRAAGRDRCRATGSPQRRAPTRRHIGQPGGGRIAVGHARGGHQYVDQRERSVSLSIIGGSFCAPRAP